MMMYPIVGPVLPFRPAVRRWIMRTPAAMSIPASVGVDGQGPGGHEDAGMVEPDDLWYKDAIFYEAPVKSFYDSNNDGIGDFRGMTEKLDYIRDLGVDCIWLLPMYPSPQKDDGYDISDFLGINPDFGTLGDFQDFLDAAHERGLRVIADLVVNHTSDQHEWFQEARRDPDSPKRNYY